MSWVREKVKRERERERERKREGGPFTFASRMWYAPKISCVLEVLNLQFIDLRIPQQGLNPG